MPLPKIVTPSFELTLPSNKKKVKYRPFLVKEEKILILAIESGGMKEITMAIKDVLKNCVLTRGVKIDELPTFDIEYLFLNIRARSIGESIDLIITCPDDEKTQVTTQIYIDEVKVKSNKGHSKDIKIDDTYTMRMKYPSLNEFVKTNLSSGGDLAIDDTFDLIASCVDQVYSEEESWAGSDCTKKELSDFVGSLNSKQFKDVEKFFDTMPKLSHKVKVKNPNTDVESEIVLEGLQSFFG